MADEIWLNLAPVLTSVGVALYHAAVHTGVHEGFEKLKEAVRNPLKNHDVAASLAESAALALRSLEREYLATIADPWARDTARMFFKSLLAQAKTALEPGRRDDAENIDPLVLLRDPSTARSVLVVSAGPGVPDDLVRLVNERFPAEFSNAFKEVGLKGNDRVRAVIVHTLLEKIVGDQAAAAARFERLEAMLVRSLEAIEQQVRDSGSASPTRGVLLLLDGSGKCLTRHFVGDRALTIGRSAECDILIPDAAVSSTHAKIRIRDRFVDLRDLGSKHGTLVDGKAIRAEALPFSSEFRIARFRLKVVPPDSLEAQGTVTTTMSDDSGQIKGPPEPGA